MPFMVQVLAHCDLHVLAARRALARWLCSLRTPTWQGQRHEESKHHHEAHEGHGGNPSPSSICSRLVFVFFMPFMVQVLARDGLCASARSLTGSPQIRVAPFPSCGVSVLKVPKAGIARSPGLGTRSTLPVARHSNVNRMRTTVSLRMSALRITNRPICAVCSTCRPTQGMASRSPIRTMRMVRASSGTFPMS